MDRRTSTILAFILINSSIAAGTATANLLVNPGFESGSLSPWFPVPNTFSGTDFKITSAVVHSGSFSALATGNKRLRQNFTPTPAANISEISFWVRHPTGGPNQQTAIDFFYSDGTGNQPVLDVQTTGWEFFNVTNLLNTNKSLSGFAIWGYTDFTTTPPSTYVDDVTIETIPEPAAPALFTVGVGLVGAMRHRRPDRSAPRRDR